MPESATRAGNETQSVLHVQGFADVLPLALEPRFMFDAAGAATAAESAEQAQADSEAENATSGSADDTTSADGGDQESAALAAALAQASSTGFQEIRAADPSQNNGRKEAVLIDTSVADWQILANGVAPGKAIILLDGARDGVSLMAQWAEGNSGYDAIHLLSHGSEGQLHVGTATLTQDKLAGRADELQMLGNALAEDGDLLLYGCDVASGEGAAFVNALATLTGADVAASTDMTGTASLGGDWELEHAAGLVTVSALSVSDYAHTLETITITNGNGDGQLNDSDGTFVKTVGGRSLTFTAGDTSGFFDATGNGAFLSAENNSPANTYNDTKITISMEAGYSFDLTAFDYYTGQSNDTITLEVTFADDSTVSGTFAATSGSAQTISDFSVFSGLSSTSLNDIKSVVVSTTNSGGNFSFGINNLVVSDVKAIVSNTAPTVTGVPTDVTVTEDTASNFDLSAVTFADTDGDNLTVTISATAGTFAATTSGSVTVGGSGANTLTLTGTAANINTWLDTTSNIQYTGASNAAGDNAATFTVKANDGTTDSTVSNGNIDITGVDDAPGVSGVPTDVTVTENTASNFDLSAVTFADIDGDSLTVTIAASAGTFAATSSGSVTVGGSGTGTLTLTGTAANINTWLDTTSNIQYTGASNAAGDNAATFTINANDGTVNPQVGGGNVDIVSAPVIGNLNGDSVTYTEGGGAVSIDAGTAATVTDSDNTDFNGGNLTVSITGGGNAAQDILGLSTGGAITLSGSTAGSTVSVGGTVIGTLANNIAAGNNLVINFDGNATPARVASLLAAIQYSNSNADDPTTGARTVRVTVTDASGGFTSSPAEVTVNVVGVNDAPTVSATGGTPTFTENGTAVDLFSGVTISTGESGQTISGMTFTVTNAEASDSITFDGTAISLVNGTGSTATNGLTYNVSVTGGVATITITGGTLSTADAQTVVDGMTYASSSDNPGTSSRVVTLTGISDSGGTANSGSDTASASIAATVAIGAVNDAPVNTVPGAQSAVSGEAKAITGISVSDTDSATVTTTVSVPNGAGTFTTTGNATITGGGTNSIEISGSVADVNATLANLRYTAATTGSQTITVLTSDGTDTDTDTVTVNVSARPAIGGLSGDSIAYTTGQTVKLDVGQNATVSDADFSADAFNNGGNLTVSITGGGTASQDILKIDTAGTVTLDGTTAGSNVRVNGTIIGTLANAIDAGNTLRINFNDAADLTNIQELVRALAYENSSGTPAGGNRTISVTLSDIDGNSSTTSTVTVSVTAPVTETPPPPPPAPTPAPTPVVSIPPILQSPGSTGGDAGTPVSNALSGGSNGNGSGGQFNSGGPIPTSVTGQLGNTSPIGNSGTPVSAGLSVNQAGSGLGVTSGLGGNGGGAALTGGGFGSGSLGGGSGGGGFGGGGLGGGGLGGGLGSGLGSGLGGGGFGGSAGGGAGGEAGTGTPVGNDGILGAPSTGGEAPVGEGGQGGEGETPTGEGGGGQAMIDGNAEAELAAALDDFSAQLAAFGDAAEMETMLLDQVLGTYRIPA